MRSLPAMVLACLIPLGLVGQQTAPLPPKPDSLAPRPDSLLLGTFQDDYGIRYRITPTTWVQLPGTTYQVERWVPGERYLIARNDSTNRRAAGRWTRIDWVLLTDMAPWQWGFCLSAWEAPTAAAAESVRVARPDTPRTGCNGFPYSRMRRISPDSLDRPAARTPA